jgi:nicotinamide/nicotinate riboside kinase
MLVRSEIMKLWRDVFEQLEMEMKREREKIIWGLVDGFLLYWNDVNLVAVEY